MQAINGDFGFPENYGHMQLIKCNNLTHLGQQQRLSKTS